MQNASSSSLCWTLALSALFWSGCSSSHGELSDDDPAHGAHSPTPPADSPVALPSSPTPLDQSPSPEATSATPSDIPPSPSPTPTIPSPTPSCTTDGLSEPPAQPPVWYLDQDGDGFGRSDGIGSRCSPGYVAARGDCDDADSAIHPGADDRTGDGIDQDCGGSDAAEPHAGFASSAWASIQQALDDAPTGATVWIGPGRWLEHELTFRGKAVTLSATDPTATTVDASQRGRVFIFESGEDLDSILDGFTLTGGRATYDGGGGVYFFHASPTIIGCTVRENSAAGATYDQGGGLMLWSSSPVFRRVTIQGNTAASGAGLYLHGSSPLLTGCLVEGNKAESKGGGLFMSGSHPTLRSCLIRRNAAKFAGGGMYLSASAPEISNCIVEENSAAGGYDSGGGGGIYLYESAAVVSSCLFSANQADFLGGAMLLFGSSPSVTNSVLVGNSAGSVGDGLYLTGAQTRPDIRGTIFLQNTGDDLFCDDSFGVPSPVLVYSRICSSNLEPVDASNVCTDPGFLAYDSAGAPLDFHLSLTSELLDVGDPAMSDRDGTRSDLGLYGGAQGDEWDLDVDHVANYFWPGHIDEAPVGFDPLAYDCDDRDALWTWECM